jgi:ER degradation enhancer, mannosidase alpha-like 1
VRRGQVVYINDPQLILGPVDESHTGQTGDRRRVVNLRFFVEDVDPMFQVQNDMHESSLDTTLMAFTSLFGGDPTTSSSYQEPLRFGHHEGVRIVQDQTNREGCLPYSQSYSNDVLVVHRGACTFLDKLRMAKETGASGVVVFSDVDTALNPSVDKKDIEDLGDSLQDVVLVVLPRSSANEVMNMMEVVDKLGLGQIKVVVDSEEASTVTDSQQLPKKMKNPVNDSSRMLYLNGQPLTNTRLLI